MEILIQALLYAAFLMIVALKLGKSTSGNGRSGSRNKSKPMSVITKSFFN